MAKTKSRTKQSENSYKNAHVFSEFAEFLQGMCDDIENSVGLFDSIGEKDEMFKELEKTMGSSPIDPMLNTHGIASAEIFKYVYSNFVGAFRENKDNFNFIHAGLRGQSEIVFFISVKDNEFKAALSDIEFNYATADISHFMKVEFMFLENDMESGLMNTEKIELNVEEIQK